MNDNSTNAEVLIRFMDGELENDESKSIIERLAADNNLAAELENLRLAKDAVKLYGLKTRISSVHTEMMKDLNAPKASAPVIGIRRILKYSSRIAAIVIMVWGTTVLYQYFTATPEQLFRDNYETFTLRETRGVSGVSVLQQPFKKGDMKTTMALFNQLKDPQAEDYFLHANAALQAGNSSEAIKSFLALQQKNKSANTHIFEEDTQYYLALAFLHNNEPAAALPLFEQIHSDKNHPYYRKVSSWFLKKLQRLSEQK
jgi:tetratricopeptide (TPR) repeat protein